MRLLFVTRASFPAVRYGGPVTNLQETCERLVDRGHGVVVICSNMMAPGWKEKRLPPGERIVGDVTIHYLDTPIRWHWEGINPGAFRVLRREVPTADLLHVAGTRHFLGTVAIAMAGRAGVPYIVTPEGSVPPRFRSRFLKGFVDAVHTRRSLEEASRVIATSDAERWDLIEWGLDEGKITVLPPLARPLAQISSTVGELRKKWGLDASESTLLWIGRIHPEKGLKVLLEALDDPRVRNVSLLLVGEGEDPEYVAELRHLAHSECLRGRVRFLGWRDGGEKAELFKASDAFVFPSRKENYGIAVVEAMSAGLPVIVTEGCGVSPLVRGRAGLVCRYDSGSLADAIARMLGDHELMRESQALGPVIASETGARVIEELEALYRTIIDDAHQASEVAG